MSKDSSQKIKNLLQLSWQARREAAIKKAAPGEHAWFQFKDEDPVPCCAFCGNMKNPKSDEKKCPGPAKITLR